MASSTKPSHGGTNLTPAPPQVKSNYVGPKARGSKFKQKAASSVLPVRGTKQPEESQEHEDDDEDNDGDDEDDEEDYREHTIHAGHLTSLKDVKARIAARRASQGGKKWDDEDDEEDDEDDEEDYREHAIHASRLTSLKDVMARIAARKAVYIAEEEAQEAVAAKAKVRKEKGDVQGGAAGVSMEEAQRTHESQCAQGTEEEEGIGVQNTNEGEHEEGDDGGDDGETEEEEVNAGPSVARAACPSTPKG